MSVPLRRIFGGLFSSQEEGREPERPEEPADHGKPEKAALPRPPPTELPPRRAVRRFLLHVDDAGQYLVATGRRLTLGHLRAAQADLPFLADVGALHAEIARTDSLRDGPVWSVRPLGGERISVEGVPVEDHGLCIGDGQRVLLGDNLAFRLSVPDPASSTVLLELARGMECAGAMFVVLLGEGEGGRLRLGSAGQRHIRVPNLEHQLSILLEQEDRLLLRCATPMRVRGGEGTRSVDESQGDGLSLPCPPKERIDLSIGKGGAGRPPFTLGLSPSGLAGGDVRP